MKRFLLLATLLLLLPCIALAECTITTVETGYPQNNEKTLLITDSILENSILEMLDSASGETDLPSSPKTNWFQCTVTAKEGSRTVIYDSLYEKAVLLDGDACCELPGDVGRFFYRLMKTETPVQHVEEAHRALFASYGQTLDYLLGEPFAITLPHALYGSCTDEAALYFTYVDLFLRDSGFDLTPYLGKQITVHIYAVREGVNRVKWMPQDAALIEMGIGVTLPIRGIALSCDEQIIGAYLSVGRHTTTFTTSLTGKSDAEILGSQSLVDYLQMHWSYNDSEKQTAALTAEELIRRYADAETTAEANACFTPTTLLESLSANMTDNALFTTVDYLPDRKLLVESIQPVDNSEHFYEVSLKPGDTCYPELIYCGDSFGYRIASFYNTSY